MLLTNPLVGWESAALIRARQSNPSVDAILQKEGFNLYGWDVNGLTMWAVTDAGPEALKTFVELEKQRIGE